jgi:hypothetical protein
MSDQLMICRWGTRCPDRECAAKAPHQRDEGCKATIGSQCPACVPYSADGPTFHGPQFPDPRVGQLQAENTRLKLEIHALTHRMNNTP